ncbi:DUF4190 domain-containing protein [Sphaerisporangium aureirubrum]|uniref:DUF4190 domain-containing protein n=1 Tax=Sphaerisporangium aureirubrum TaxID=1544736 RepID=A0ABW1NDD6_9ACTN
MSQPYIPEPDHSAYPQQPAPQGYPQHTAPPPSPPASHRGAPASNGLGTAALVLGIISCVLLFVPAANGLDVILGIISAVCGITGLFVARNGAVTRGTAIAGLALGIIAILLAVFTYPVQ